MLLTWLFSAIPGTSLLMPQTSCSIVHYSLAHKDLQGSKQNDHGIPSNYKTRVKKRRKKATGMWEGKEEEECNVPWFDWSICFFSTSIHIPPGTNWDMLGIHQDNEGVSNAVSAFFIHPSFPKLRNQQELIFSFLAVKYYYIYIISMQQNVTFTWILKIKQRFKKFSSCSEAYSKLPTYSPLPLTFFAGSLRSPILYKFGESASHNQ